MLLLLSVVQRLSATVYFTEEFNKGWRENWVESQTHQRDKTNGRVVSSPGQWYGDWVVQSGLKTTDDKKFYLYTRDIGQTISNRGKPLIISYTIKHEDSKEAAGAYIKLLPETINQEEYKSEDPFELMFGLDITSRLSALLKLTMTYMGEQYELRKFVTVPLDRYTHMYTLIIRPNNTMEVLLDGKRLIYGLIRDLFEILGPRMIADETVKKPADWIDDPEIPDPNGPQKPADWDDRPFIVDPDAKKPDNWDEIAEDMRLKDEQEKHMSKKEKSIWEQLYEAYDYRLGFTEKDRLDPYAWVPPEIPNPAFKGKWTQRMIPNPDYKGPWSPPLIPNPKWRQANYLYLHNIRYVAIDVYQEKAGTIYDNIFIGDDMKEWELFANQTFFPYVEEEKERAIIIIQRERRRQSERTNLPPDEEIYDENDAEFGKVNDIDEEDKKKKIELPVMDAKEYQETFVEDL
ncbi:putative Calnexin like protein [Blattamonas nauphoetae]|uniref:Calnexin like protein n=1 Tax=Blattamonas nauphoetae TaxID=2049346 RepID=A0ABQ9XAP1_9EUKA|nr:putative Calnexin like protein [Blattamonas nauphoetae]